jgi:hypothetical protein
MTKHKRRTRSKRGSYLSKYLNRAYAQIRKQHGLTKRDTLSKAQRMRAFKLAHQLRNRE